MRSIINILLLVCPLALLGQNADSVKAVAAKEKPSYLPTGIRFGTDVVALVRSGTDKNFSGYEINAEVDFYRYYLTVESGRWERSFTTSEEGYSNEGNYFRIGVDVNFLLKDPDKNMFFFGMRYGRSTYTENFTLTTQDPVWGNITMDYTNKNLGAGWGELTTGLRVKMWKFFWMGYTARLKFGLNSDQPGDFVSYDVPGYGKVDEDNTTWGFNYYLLFRLPFKKEKPVKAD